MPFDPSVFTNVGIGGAAIGALVFVTNRFLEKLEKRAEAHERAMKEREDALRVVEKEVRTSFGALLAQSNAVIGENTRVLSRVITHLDKH